MQQFTLSFGLWSCTKNGKLRSCLGPGTWQSWLWSAKTYNLIVTCKIVTRSLRWQWYIKTLKSHFDEKLGLKWLEARWMFNIVTYYCIVHYLLLGCDISTWWHLITFFTLVTFCKEHNAQLTHTHTHTHTHTVLCIPQTWTDWVMLAM